MQTRDYLSLICSMSELSRLLSESRDIQTFLDRMVRMVAGHLQANVCSIYFYHSDKQQLTLRATFGLNPDSVGKVRMGVHEGLVGLVMSESRTVMEKHASKSKYYKYFPDTHEKKYESFLGVPVMIGSEKIGVLVVQRKEKDYFTPEDQKALSAIASQLAGAIENVRILIAFDKGDHPETAAPVHSPVIYGQAASPGIAYAPCHLHQTHKIYSTQVSSGKSISDELMLFETALSRTITQIEAIQQRVMENLPEAASLIFSAHLLMLKDGSFVSRIRDVIDQRQTAFQAIAIVAENYRNILAESGHALIREKVNDLDDLTHRLINNLNQDTQYKNVFADHIIIAESIYPSDVIKFVFGDVKGVLLIGGGVTTHVSILARSFHLPMVISEQTELLRLKEKTWMLLDGDVGNCYIHPSKRIVDQFQVRLHSEKQAVAYEKQMLDETVSMDDVRIHLLANINLLSELQMARRLKAEGVGLYRSEFPFLIRSNFPTEDEQVQIYRILAENMSDKEITIRTLDLGGEKALAYYDHGKEANPELGLRSTRFALSHPDLFENQIRAILRACADVKILKIMFPMIGSIDDFQKAKVIVQSCIKSLARKKEPHYECPELGAMIELPSIVEVMTEFVYEADFFSIGTNDFIQYTLGVDRGNEKVASYFTPHHPAILRKLSRVVEIVNEAGKQIRICGEMAHQTEYLPLLLGMGLTQFSVDPQYLGKLQKTIQRLNMSDCRSFFEAVRNESTLRGVEHLMDQVEQMFPAIKSPDVNPG